MIFARLAQSIKIYLDSQLKFNSGLDAAAI